MVGDCFIGDIVIRQNWSIVYVKGEKVAPFEYLCGNCHQLRLALVKVDVCGNCGSINIIKGKLGPLERSRANELEGKD